MDKPIFKKATARDPVCTRSVLLDGDGGMIQVSPDLLAWKRSECDYHGERRTVPLDVISRALSIDSDPVISESAHSITVTKGKAAVNIPYQSDIEPDDFPLPDFRDGELAWLALPGLAEAVQRVAYAMPAPSHVKYKALHGVAVRVVNGRPSVVATDGHRMHRVDFPVISHDDTLDREVIIPRCAVPYIGANLIEIDVSSDRKADQQVRIGDLIFSPLPDKYPDVDRITPKGYDQELIVDRKQLIDWLALWLKTLTGRLKTEPHLCLEWSRDILRASTSSDQERMDLGLSLPVVSSDDGCVGINGQYLLDALRHLDGETVTISNPGPRASANSPLLLDDQVVIMPVRI